MKKNILIINICKEKLHYYEFVKPIEDIVQLTREQYNVKHYSKLTSNDIKTAKKIIICGTSLADNTFIDHESYFSWLREFDLPVLGICGGMHMIGIIFGGKGLLRKKTEIGFFSENIKKTFLGMSGKIKVYHLHSYYVDFSLLDDFEIYSGKEISQAVRHGSKNIYGVLFHPEVRQKELILHFCNVN